MTGEEYRAAMLDVAYLAASQVNGSIPDGARIGKMNLEHLYETAERHMLSGITAMALESAGVKRDGFTQAKGKAIRKVAAFDMERAAVLQALEEAGIWYMPLKGAVLKSLYPRIGMRQMADNDILCDASKTSQVRAVMERLGFSANSTHGEGIHDEYCKPPVCIFEMHRMLFGPIKGAGIAEYYQNVKDRLILNEGSRYGYHFSDADFYLYMIAHEYKHYYESGTGLRSVLDTYVYLKKKGETLDWAYIAEELEKLGIADFEARNRSLALHLFGGEGLTARDEEMLAYIQSSGTYGNMQNYVTNKMRDYGSGPFGKLRYVMSRLFLPMNTVRASFPLFAKYPVLLPFLPLYRVIREVTVRRAKLRAELKALAEVKSNDN